VQRCCVHKLRNLERKAPKHALAEIRDDFHRSVYAADPDTARAAFATFERAWAKRCPRVVASLPARRASARFDRLTVLS
jgi:transposase-like protein